GFASHSQARLVLLSTAPSSDTVTVDFQPVECLVERISTSSSGAISGARVRQRHSKSSKRVKWRLAERYGPRGNKRTCAHARRWRRSGYFGAFIEVGPAESW